MRWKLSDPPVLGLLYEVFAQVMGSKIISLRSKHVQKSDRPGRQRRALTDGERIEMAKLRFTPLDTGRMRTYAEIGRKFARSPSVVEQAVKDARRRGLIKIEVRSLPLPSHREKPLELQLETHFPTTPYAIVVKGICEKYGADDPHERLGTTLAHFMEEERRWLFDGKPFAVAGGRGVYYTIRCLRYLAPREHKWRAASVGSLCGVIGEQPIAPLNEDLITYDGDSQAAFFSCCFGQGDSRPGASASHGTIVRAMGHRIAVQLQSDAAKVLEASWIMEPTQWGPPQRAVLGVGVLTGNNRVYRAARLQDKNQFTAAINTEVINLYKLARKFSTADYCPVADIAHRFFFVPPPPGSNVSVDESTIQRLIDKINGRLVAAPFEKLREIPEIILVAGGAKKAPALYHVLSQHRGQPQLSVKVLCTDEDVANRLLKYCAAAAAPRTSQPGS